MTFVKKRRSLRLAFVFSAVVLAALIIFSAATGAANISFIKAMRIMLHSIPLAGGLIPSGDIDTAYSMIVLNIRLPRIILSALVGAGLSVVGAVLQGMFKNPMADPYVLGISSGASLGASIAIALGLEYAFLGVGIITVFAFIGSVLTMICVYSIARVEGRVPSTTLLLAGIAFGFMLSSLVSIMMIFNRKQVERIVFWIMGSVSAASWNQVAILFPIVFAGIVVITAFARDLNIMSTGEEAAKSLGVEVEGVKKCLLLVCSVIVAACVSVSGIIGFVGLIIPHAVRLVTGSDHRGLLPLSAVVGAGFMVACDTIARNAVPPVEIPVGAITSIFGAPYFIHLLYKNKKKVFG
ncbi:iron complex transport system permease protein [Anaerobacterium chartisolvens]|uniref:Iron complex transport system permease protein n=1 Tax=Anaerobacterium chartisolvens TaxID=1297424 RepID=A0A369BEZ5_9FIRM|nr:iron chelate uptake ABC transporter family permease subunit [Anaerobacterium chartisolvens]RCX20110.1 iron complex transport system permease protein [Anaerobacterium chartisolvens]